MVRTIIIASLSIAAIGAASPALADNQGAPVRIVSYSDLNLGTTHGVTTLDRRIAAAINDMCGTTGGDLDTYLAEKACRLASVASVKSQRLVAIASAGGDRMAVLAGR